MMEDARDEWLNGYDDLIQVFDLDLPDGLSSMAALNVQLANHMGQIHPQSREYLHHSLRGDGQTSHDLFGASDLCSTCPSRIAEGTHIEKLRPVAHLPGSGSTRAVWPCDRE
jgi:hypothetical protein